jgi:hypothetical protein
MTLIAEAAGSFVIFYAAGSAAMVSGSPMMPSCPLVSAEFS